MRIRFLLPIAVVALLAVAGVAEATATARFAGAIAGHPVTCRSIDHLPAGRYDDPVTLIVSGTGRPLDGTDLRRQQWAPCRV